ncbi:MAG: NADPH:quinone reductase [Acidimicrobiales bacterium]
MRAAVYRELGPADVLHIEDLPEPHPGAGEVRVRIRVSGVNPTDWKTRTGGPGAQMPYEYVVPNKDGAGVVDEVGEGVEPDRVGERVWVFAGQRQHGTAAEWTCLPERKAVELPDEVGFDFGASIGIPALTARHALLCDGQVAGSTVLVSGGAGAVGHFAVELARRAGAKVITTVSGPEKAALAETAGANVVLDYTEGDVVQKIRDAAPDGVDRVVEVAPSNLELDSEVLALYGTVVHYASADENPVLPVRAFMNLNATIRCMLLYTIPQADLDAAVADVSAALAEGALSPLPFHRFGLEQIADAHRAVEKGVTGKVIVEID